MLTLYVPITSLRLAGNSLQTKINFLPTYSTSYTMNLGLKAEKAKFSHDSHAKRQYAQFSLKSQAASDTDKRTGICRALLKRFLSSFDYSNST
jgi:hypothetical protein